MESSQWLNWNHLFCRKVSFLHASHCYFRGVGQGMKQTYIIELQNFYVCTKVLFRCIQETGLSALKIKRLDCSINVYFFAYNFKIGFLCIYVKVKRNNDSSSI